MNTQNFENDMNTKWIEGLALEELNMEESGVIELSEHLNPVHLLEESSIDFMNILRDLFEVYVSKFNEYRGGASNSHSIKIFKISNTVNDFMLFRNSLRLIFARKANDLITIGFLANGKDLFSARLNATEAVGSGHIHEISAHLGAFNKITWNFNGETVEHSALVRHYLSEFIKNSAR